MTTRAPLLADLAARLAQVVEVSPADDTELVWIETVAASAGVGEREASSSPPRRQRIAQVRVALGRDPGAQRTGFQCLGFPATGRSAGELPAASELENAMRAALGQARLAAPAPWRWEPPGSGESSPPAVADAAPERDGDGLHDPRVAALDEQTAIGLLESGLEGGERLRLEWGEVRLAVANSRGLTRSATATTLTLAAVVGRGPTAGRAAASARTLDALAAPPVVGRARRR
ncbi:MAG TPA: hypothetical protein VHQ65_00240, partial [Thermoanaerobaculia bacterium]|nr:hypothetical protein [Thermoanaerobaculia bacterium]